MKTITITEPAKTYGLKSAYLVDGKENRGFLGWMFYIKDNRTGGIHWVGPTLKRVALAEHFKYSSMDEARLSVSKTGALTIQP